MAEEFIGFRVSSIVKDRAQRIARIYGVSISEYCRRLLINDIQLQSGGHGQQPARPTVDPGSQGSDREPTATPDTGAAG